MTDYLEELLENAGVLLEEMRRLERNVSGPFSQGVEEIGSSTPRPVQSLLKELARDGDEEEQEELPLHRAAERERPGNLLDAMDKDEASEKDVFDRRRLEKDRMDELPEKSGVPLEEAERREERSALLEQVRQLERTVGAGMGNTTFTRAATKGGLNGGGRSGSASGLAGAGHGTLYPGGAEPTLESWSPGAGFDHSGLTPEGGLRWAEQADREFRRDSRRYDGGFYLF